MDVGEWRKVTRRKERSLPFSLNSLHNNSYPSLFFHSSCGWLGLAHGILSYLYRHRLLLLSFGFILAFSPVRPLSLCF